jgi:ubiquinone/menaquinone biosynthesis C-methylase UbiE
MVVLDVGCGPGAFHRRLAEAGARIVGLDRSPGMVSEVRQQADRSALPVLGVHADAQALPIADASCDRVIAIHVLFHVPDRELALREIRRVLRPGGRAVLATNAADSMARLTEIHEAAARSLGYTPSPPGYERFSLEHLDLVRAVFPGAQRLVYSDAFVFPDVPAVLRYYASGKVDNIEERPADGSHRKKLLPLVADRIEATIAREGVFRVPKAAGCFVAEV